MNIVKRGLKFIRKKHLLSKLNAGGSGKVGFIDIGAIGGIPEEWLNKTTSIRSVLAFEPNDKPYESRSLKTIQCALWETEEDQPFYIYGNERSVGASILKQNYAYVRANFETLKVLGPKQMADTWFERSALLRTTSIKCRTLDSILDENLKRGPFHFAKIDAQGAELPILKGGHRWLKTDAVGLMLETFSIPLYENVAMLPEIQKYLEGMGFTFVKKFESHGTFDSQNDCLFLKKGSNPEIEGIIMDVYRAR
jgi:FkbM family methyltransferase